MKTGTKKRAKELVKLAYENRLDDGMKPGKATKLQAIMDAHSFTEVSLENDTFEILLNMYPNVYLIEHQN